MFNILSALKNNDLSIEHESYMPGRLYEVNYPTKILCKDSPLYLFNLFIKRKNLGFYNINRDYSVNFEPVYPNFDFTLVPYPFSRFISDLSVSCLNLTFKEVLLAYFCYEQCVRWEGGLQKFFFDNTLLKKNLMSSFVHSKIDECSLSNDTINVLNKIFILDVCFTENSKLRDDGIISKDEGVSLTKLNQTIEKVIDHQKWEIKNDQDWSVAHEAAIFDQLPANFNKWDLKDGDGNMVPRIAAIFGNLPDNFDKWDMKDDSGVTVWDIFQEHTKNS